MGSGVILCGFCELKRWQGNEADDVKQPVSWMEGDILF
jgi:hypothetical protein